MLSTTLVTPPQAEPVSLVLAKQHLRVDFDDEDDLIESYITAAREYCEKATRRAFFNQTWLRTMDFFPIWNAVDRTHVPSDRAAWPYPTWFWNKLTIDLPYPRLVSVESIVYTDSDGTEQTLSTDSYTVDPSSTPGRIAPSASTIWPWTNIRRPGNVKITFVAGSYGDGGDTNTCPKSIVQAMLLLISHWYQNREAVSALTYKAVPMAVDALLSIHKLSAIEYR
jgi:uncharacterized phiE125 gp8 family phage protein